MAAVIMTLVCPMYMAATNFAAPGTVNQNTSLIGQTAASPRRVATGRSCTEAPIAVVAKIPSVKRWTVASAGPGPPRKLGIWLAPARRASHIKIWKTAAAAKKRNGIEAGSSRPFAPDRKVAAIVIRSSGPCAV